MSISEAARLVGKSVKTIRRWQRSGVKVFDEAALREHSDFMDIRSRGAAAKLALNRLDGHKANQVLVGGIRSHFPAVPNQERFYDVPSPIDPDLQQRAIWLLETIHALFTERLRDLRTVGHEQSVQMGEEDLRNISEGRRLIEMVLNSFYD